MIKKIATHNKIFHADEVTAIALLKIFTDNNIQVDRLEHNTIDFSSYDMVLDIGKKFDGIKYFDHHQYKGGKSSAGLIWEYLGLENDYPKISELIKLIDKNDVGIKKSKPFEYSSLIRHFNHSDIYGKEQDVQFFKAVDFAVTILTSMIELEDSVQNAKSIVKNSYLFENSKNILELDEFTPHWSTYINGNLVSNIKAVVWEDKNDKNWKIKIVPKKLGSYELVSKPLINDTSMEFVHQSGHFAIAKDKKTLIEYCERNRLY